MSKKYILSSMLLLSSFLTAQQSVAQTSGGSSGASKVSWGDTMNWTDCFKYQEGSCSVQCGQFRVYGTKYTFREPVAVVETFCKESQLDKSNGNGSKTFTDLKTKSGSDAAGERCYADVQAEGGGSAAKRQATQVIVWDATSKSIRRKSSASSEEVNKADKCNVIAIPGYDVAALTDGASSSMNSNGNTSESSTTTRVGHACCNMGVNSTTEIQEDWSTTTTE